MNSIRDVLRESISSNSSVKSGSSPVNTRLVEIEPVFRTDRVNDRIEYLTIRDHLNIKTLREIAKNTCLLPVEVNETSEYLSYQYPRHDKIYISKRTWRIYAEVNNEHTMYQAFMLVRFLAKFGYVIDYKRIQQKRKGVKRNGR